MGFSTIACKARTLGGETVGTPFGLRKEKEDLLRYHLLRDNGFWWVINCHFLIDQEIKVLRIDKLLTSNQVL